MFGAPNAPKLQNFSSIAVFVWCTSELRNTAMLEKILKFWGMRGTKHCNARKISKILKFPDLWQSSLHSFAEFPDC